LIGSYQPGEDGDDEGCDGNPKVEAADGERGLQPKDDEHADDEHEPHPAAFAHDEAPEQGEGGEDEDLDDGHLEALIDPRRAAIGGEDDERDEDEAEEKGKKVLF